MTTYSSFYLYSKYIVGLGHRTYESLCLLVGKTILAVYRTKENGADYFGFETAEGNFAFQAHGACCSESWIENIDILAKLPARVLEVSERTEDGQTDFGNFIKIKTDKGYIDIDGRSDGGSTECYSFEYCLLDTDTIHDLIFAEVNRIGYEAWKEYNQTRWFYAPGFNPKEFTGFSKWKKVI